MLAHRLRRWSSIKPTLVQRLVFAGLRSIAAGLVSLTAGGDYKPTPTQCLLNFGPASSVLASIHSALVSTSCWRYQHAGATNMLAVPASPALGQRLVFDLCTIESAGQKDINKWDKLNGQG